MADILAQLKKLFGSRDVYKVLNVAKSAKQDQLKKAYYKVSLKVHPDKVSAKEKDVATEKFQLLSKVFKLMSDKKKRELYDKTGELETEDDDFGLSDIDDWMSYWRELFPPISVDDIKDFHSSYKGSDEELEALKKAYRDSKGDMGKIIETVMCASYTDEDRFRTLLLPLIESKELPSYKKFTDEPAASRKRRLAQAKAEAKEADKMAEEIQSGSKNSDNDLVLALKKNREKRGGILSYLEEKYGNLDDETDVAFTTSSKRAAAKSGKKPARKSSQPPAKRSKKK